MNTITVSGQRLRIVTPFVATPTDFMVKAVDRRAGESRDDFPIEMGMSNPKYDLQDQSVSQGSEAFVLDYFLAKAPNGQPAGHYLYGEHTPIRKDASGKFRLLGRPPETFIGYPVEAKASENELYSRGYLYNKPSYPRAKEIYEQIRDDPNRHPYHVSIEGISTEPEEKTNVIRKTVVLNALIHPITINPYTWISPGHSPEIWSDIAKALMAGEIEAPGDISTLDIQPQDRGDKYRNKKQKRRRAKTNCKRGCETLKHQLNKAVGTNETIIAWLRHLVVDHGHTTREAMQFIEKETIPHLRGY